MNVNLSHEQEDRIKSLMLDGQTFQESLTQIINLGCYQLEYRRKTNPKKSVENKLARQILKIARLDPEMSEKFGLGKRVTL
jgi:hypothetical protein